MRTATPELTIIGSDQFYRVGEADFGVPGPIAIESVEVERHRTPGAAREDLTYDASKLDRAVVAEDQLRTVLSQLFGLTIGVA